MQILIHSINSVLIILCLIFLGYILAYRHWFNDDSKNLISNLITKVALPADIIVTFTQNFTLARLVILFKNIIYPLLSITLMFFLGIIFTKIFHINIQHRGAFQALIFSSSTIFIGLPINLALFGVKSEQYVLLYYVINTLYFWIIGVLLIQSDTQKYKFNIKVIIHNIISPALIGLIIGILLVLVNIKLPSFLLSSLQYIGNLTVPLAMIFIGISIQKVNFHTLKISKDNLLIIMSHAIIAPIIMTLLVIKAPITTLAKEVFIIMAAMPAMTVIPPIVQTYHGDVKFAAISVTETTLAIIITIPIIYMLIHVIL